MNEKKKLYFYRVGYYSFEDSHYDILCHELSFSKDEFRTLCIEAAVELVRNWVSADLPVPGVFVPDAEGSGSGSGAVPPRSSLLAFDHLSIEIPGWLVKNRGFIPLQVSEEFCISGWDQIDGESGYFQCEETARISRRLLEEQLLPQISTRNEQLDKYWHSLPDGEEDDDREE